MWDPSSLARDQTHTPALEGDWPGREGPVTVRVMLLSYVPQEAWGARHQPVYGRDSQTEMSCLHRSSPDK